MLQHAFSSSFQTPKVLLVQIVVSCCIAEARVHRFALPVCLANAAPVVPTIHHIHVHVTRMCWRIKVVASDIGLVVFVIIIVVVFAIS